MSSAGPEQPETARRAVARGGLILIASAIVIGVLGRSVELLLPVILDSAGRALDLSNAALGGFAAAELAGITLASVAGYRLAPRLAPAPTAIAGALLLALANALTPFVATTGQLIALRFAAGALGEGPLLIAAISVLGATARASRVYAIFMAAQMAFGAAALAGFGFVEARAGFVGVMGGLAALSAFGVLAAFGQPFRGPLAAPPAAPRNGGAGLRGWAALTGMGLFHIGVSALWAFLQQKAGALGLSPATGGLLLSIMMGSGLAGTAWVMGPGAARRSLGLTCLALGLAGPAAVLAGGPALYLAAGVVLMIAWNISVPHQIAQLGQDLDARGLLPLVPGFQGVGLAAGPAIAGLVSAPGEYRAVAGIVALAAAASAACFLYAGGRLRS
ncbi:hypothetical protein DDZ18_09560 [Marinicauda salina]|uniref:MFS transporter n=1 Tax=Marinicauda salina TaxID=2135793 RepID=A0A2U2BSH2_9PROT|nr:hypothetical protein [Marinicauda salina]PWE16947.1 hypothetical protein DDZ18_09560 [Marinicauda salina]